MSTRKSALFIGAACSSTPQIVGFVDLLYRWGLWCLVFEPARYRWNTAFWLSRTIGGNARARRSDDCLEHLPGRRCITWR